MFKVSANVQSSKSFTYYIYIYASGASQYYIMTMYTIYKNCLEPCIIDRRLPEQQLSHRGRIVALTAAVTTARTTVKIEDPSRGPWREDFRGPDKGFGFGGDPET